LETIGPYKLIRKLATGGMADVYLAQAVAKPEAPPIVVKKILSHLAHEPKFVEMFLSEAKIASQLRHPNLVKILDLGEHEGEIFLVMEYVDGLTLRGVIRNAASTRTQLPLAFCAQVISSACAGLDYAHDFCNPQSGDWLGLIHRDVTPENILLSKDGNVKVVDFGLAKAAAIQSSHTHTLRGKYHYMAPEQFRRKEALDRRVDIYALGVVLYEMVTGVPPYPAQGQLALMRAILQNDIVEASKRRADVPPALSRILSMALADREKRYATCRAFARDLDSFSKELSGSVPPPPEVVSKQPTGSPSITDAVSQLVTHTIERTADEPGGVTEDLDSEAPPSSQWWPWAALLLLALLIGFGYAALNCGSDSSTKETAFIREPTRA
jgi:serine/threonine-protein kinase